MLNSLRWDPCISHKGDDTLKFINEYFSGTDRRVLLIAGAGFDPRSSTVAEHLGKVCKDITQKLIKEERPDPNSDLVARADNNAKTLKSSIKHSEVINVDIFGTDNAVIGGRQIVHKLNQVDYSEVTDIVVDISALSTGISFPILRYLVERSQKYNPSINLHVFLTHNPDLDSQIVPTNSDSADYIHGFKGQSTLDHQSEAAKLWLPQLVSGRRGALNTLFAFLQPHDTCPIVPFPASSPRKADKLFAEYLAELESTWSVDTRNILYADETDPLDLYRTILRLDDLRKPVFFEVGGSLLILSPLGSKIMALGCFMAALERDLPVAYVEAISYDLISSTPQSDMGIEIVHVWLEGDVYLNPRPPLANMGY